MTDEIAVNIPDLEAEISKLSPTDMAKELLAIRVRQKTTQKRNYNPEKMKVYQQKQREKARALKERALQTAGTENNPATGKLFPNMWEQINYHAEQEAEKKIQEEQTPEAEETSTANA